MLALQRSQHLQPFSLDDMNSTKETLFDTQSNHDSGFSECSFSSSESECSDFPSVADLEVSINSVGTQCEEITPTDTFRPTPAPRTCSMQLHSKADAPITASRVLLRQYGLQSMVNSDTFSTKDSSSIASTRSKDVTCQRKHCSGMKDYYKSVVLDNYIIPRLGTEANMSPTNSMFHSRQKSELYFPKHKRKGRIIRAACLYRF